ncbi:hypothetical protein M011DRAFT_132920 [Sporormia fimetaria CBS 119925]|uniref:Uncharacterized protein n=1 Tax=Sporormia fimetaria CBS 119925 TaxID=1340428 RepID=A0A6A6V6P7_9PLEO|nr:hypothetical protein M011DRAFT_132920 [Sporormia fimetaria CBS 119925]
MCIKVQGMQHSSLYKSQSAFMSVMHKKMKQKRCAAVCSEEQTCKMRKRKTVFLSWFRVVLPTMALLMSRSTPWLKVPRTRGPHQLHRR